ncbi:predicted protein [Lichtheimia corymbifera JMRC:FSU:9682]|uniref:Uncharacterized protein n=1 Tax=Lichtheimia corymbifera JMRC:FSU:9682 TaxID=1263082 RepID=A0A068S5I0_9FUNG|nr:predicted protein [Lichtheimia corymbifera JMRC:FSU:9682]
MDHTTVASLTHHLPIPVTIAECIYTCLKEAWIVAITSACYGPVAYVWIGQDGYAQRQDLEEAEPNGRC